MTDTVVILNVQVGQFELTNNADQDRTASK